MVHVVAGEFTISENQEPDPFKVKAFAKKLANASLGILFSVFAHPLLDLNLR